MAKTTSSKTAGKTNAKAKKPASGAKTPASVAPRPARRSKAPAATPAEANPTPAPPAHTPPAAAPDAGRKTTLLDAAHAVLLKLNRPMRVKEIMAEITDRGLWQSPNGATPEATLAAAILRDMARHGEDSRFTRADRGYYAARRAEG